MAKTLKSYLHNFFSTPLSDFTTRKHVPTLVAAIISCFIASFMMPLFSIILGSIFDEFTYFGAGDITSQELLKRVSDFCLQFLALGALGWFWNAVYFVLFVVYGELQAASARSRLFEGLLEKDQRFFEEHEEGTRTFLGYLQM